MAEHDEFELRVVESTATLPARKLARPGPPIRRRAAPTPAEALEALRATKGGATVIERLPGLGETDAWGEIAYWNVCEAKGAAQNEVFLWDCDFPGGAWTMFDGYANCVAYFAGADELSQVVPPDFLTGQVWC